MDFQAGTYNFYHEDIPSPFGKFNEFRMEKKFTDIILVTKDGTEFYVHKIIIFMRCPYFEALYNSDAEKFEKAKIQLNHSILPKDFEAILVYIYTGDIEITSENAVSFNEIACYLGMIKLKEASEKVLEKIITKENILTVWRWANKFWNVNVEKMCLEYVRKNPQLILEHHLLSLEYDEIKIIASFAVFELGQDQLYTKLTNWIKENFENRQKYIKDLLNYIDFTKLSDEYKTNVKRDRISFSNADFDDILIDLALNVPNSTDCDDLIFAISPKNIGALKLREPNPYIVPVIECDFNTTFKPVYCKLDKILLCGLGDGSECKMFSYGTRDLQLVSPMIDKRIGFDAIELNERIYVCGGAEENFMEIYDINNNNWTKCTKWSSRLHFSRYSLKMCKYRQSILLLGGCRYTHSSCCPNKYIQRYDPRESIWEIVIRDALPMPNIQDVFVMKDESIRCLYKEDNKLLITGYDFRNQRKFELSNELPNFLHYNLYESKGNIYILGEEFEMKSKFGLVEDLDSENAVKSSAIPDMDLAFYNNNNNNHIIKLLNIGADRYNYFGTIY